MRFRAVIEAPRSFDRVVIDLSAPNEEDFAVDCRMLDEINPSDALPAVPRQRTTGWFRWKPDVSQRTPSVNSDIPKFRIYG
ncbi:hypothetical protein GCM10009525_25780 [Streptosporangium amethystogenes subsp. fukuiense]